MNEIVFAGLVFAAGLMSGATAAVVGFGIGSLLTPLLLMRVDPHLAVSVIAVPHALATALRFVQHRKAVDYALLRRFGAPSAAGGLLGAMFQDRLTSSGLLVFLGLLLIATGLVNMVKTFRAWKPPVPVAFTLGAASGFFGGVAGNQGGLRAASLTAFSLPPRVFLATSTAVALAIDLARTPVYVARSHQELTAYAPVIVVASAGCLAGTILGERIFLGLSPDRYRIGVGAAVAAVGVLLLVQGL